MQLVDDCCNKCEATRILGQLVHGVADDENRRKLLEVGDNLTLDDAVKIIRAAENAHQQASDLRGASSIQGISTPKSQKNKNHAKSNKPKEKLALHQVNLCRKVPRTRIKRDVGTVATTIAIQSRNVQLRDRNARSVREKAIFPACVVQRAPKKQQLALSS